MKIIKIGHRLEFNNWLIKYYIKQEFLENKLIKIIIYITRTYKTIKMIDANKK
jgi:hypothetical protein